MKWIVKAIFLPFVFVLTVFNPIVDREVNLSQYPVPVRTLPALTLKVNAQTSAVPGNRKGQTGKNGEGTQDGLFHIASPQMTDRDRNYGNPGGASSSGSTISGSGVTLSRTSYTYDGQAKKPAVTVRCGGKKLRSKTDYTVSYSSCTNAGTARVTVCGKGKYRGKVTKTYRINKAGQNLRVKKDTYILSCSALKKSAVKLSAKALNARGSLSWKSGSKYVSVTNGRITVRKGTPRGTWKVSVKASGTGNYKPAAAAIRIIVR